MPIPTGYGQLARLAEQLCAEFPAITSISLLTNEAVFRLEAAGFIANRVSCNKALVTQLKKLRRPISSEHTSSRPTLDETVVVVVTPTQVLVEEQGPAEEAAPWEIIDGNYTWQNKQGNYFCRAIADVDEMFYAYSRHGLNLSQVQMIHDFGLSLWEWNTLKSRVLLQKESNIFSPHTVNTTPVNLLESMIAVKMARRYERLGPLIERTYRDTAVKELNKVLLAQEKKDARLQRLALELSDLLPQLKYRYVARAPKRVDGPEHLIASIADPHIGAEVKRLLNGPRYDNQMLYHYADQFIERINARGAANVYLNGLGDFIESFAGANHANTFLSLNKDLAGAGGIFGALEFFSYLVEKIYNVREIWGVSGNHDRTSNRKDEDTRGEGAFMLFGLLKERYSRTDIKVLYRPDVLVRVVDGICYLNTHMHLELAKNEKKLADTIARHRVQGLYCVVMGAHLHSRITKMDTDDSCVRHSPSFFTGNGYSSDGGYSTLAGFLTSENINNSGYPRVVDEPLYPANFHLNQVATCSFV